MRNEESLRGRLFPAEGICDSDFDKRGKDFIESLQGGNWSTIFSSCGISHFANGSFIIHSVQDMIIKFKKFFAIFLVEPFTSFALNCAWSRRFVCLHINYQTLLYYTPRYSKRPLVCKGMLIDVGALIRSGTVSMVTAISLPFTFIAVVCIVSPVD